MRRRTDGQPDGSAWLMKRALFVHVAALLRRGLWIIIVASCAACSTGEPAPKMGPVQARPNQDSVRIGGSALVSPMLRRMARLFTQEYPGRPVVVEMPIAPEGARKALQDGVLDGVLAIDPEQRSGETRHAVASSRLVLALGPGIAERTLDIPTLVEHVAGAQADWTYLPSLEMELMHALERRAPRLAKALRESHSRQVSSGLNYGRPLWEQLTAVRGGLTLADSGNIRFLAAPVWVAELTGLEKPTLMFSLIVGPNPPPRLTAFITYLSSEQGRLALQEMGFQAGEQSR